MNIQFLITDYCNLKCENCSNGSPLINDKYEMSLCEFKDILKLTLNDNINIIHLLGGEPTIHPQFKDFVEYFSYTYPDKKLRMITNGYKLLEYKDLISKFDFICVSHYLNKNDDIIDNIKPNNKIKIIKYKQTDLRDMLIPNKNRRSLCKNIKYAMVRDYMIYPCCSIFGNAIWNNIPLASIGISLKQQNWKDIYNKINIENFCKQCSY